MPYQRLKQLLPMIVSIVLLASFLVVYLYRNYNNIESELNKQAQLYLENAFKTAESQMFDKMLIELKGVSVFHKKDKGTKDLKWVDRKMSVFTFDTMTKTSVKSVSLGNKTGSMVLKPRKDNLPPDTSISVKIEIKSDSLKLDTAFNNTEMSDFVLVKAIFEKNINEAGLYINYALTDDSLKRGEITNPKYSEIFTGKKYYLNIDNNNWYIINKLMPDILLSVLLFVAVVFAFYHMISSYKKNQELYDLKDDFVRNMTHELKTPLATMGVAIEALQNFKADGDKLLRAEYLRIAESENMKLNDLVDKVLSTTRHLDTKTNSYENVHLPQLIDEILESFKLRLEQRSIQYSVTNRLIMETAHINHQVIAMAIHNLIDNAIKYIHHSSPILEIHLYDDDKNIFISIKDNGTRIPHEYAGRIFEKFFRIPQGNVHDVKGHGLGLFIVRKLLLSVKGNIRLKILNEGNEFLIEVSKQTVQV